MASPYQSLAPVVSGEGGGGGGTVDTEARILIGDLTVEVAAVRVIAETAQTEVNATEIVANTAAAAVIVAQGEIDAAEILIAALDSRVDSLESAPPPEAGLPSWALCNAEIMHYTDSFRMSDVSLNASYITIGDVPRATLPSMLGALFNPGTTAVGEGTVAAVIREIHAVLIAGDFEYIIRIAVDTIPTATASYLFRCGMTSKPTNTGTPNSFFAGFEITATSAVASGIRAMTFMGGVNFTSSIFIPIAANTVYTCKLKWIKSLNKFEFYVNDMVTPVTTYTYAISPPAYTAMIYGYFARLARTFGTELAAICYVDSMYIKQTLDVR